MAQRLYGLFKDGKRKFPELAYVKADAIRRFQDHLIYDGCELKPLKAAKESPDLIQECPKCRLHLHTEHVAEYLNKEGRVKRCTCACTMVNS